MNKEELDQKGNVICVLTLPKPPCDHEWPDECDTYSQCLKCGMSLMRHAFMECP